MKYKNIILLSSLALLFSCGEPSTSDSTPISEQISNFELFKNAITFKTNNSFTGYRLIMTIKNNNTNEQVYSLIRTIAIDTINDTCELNESITRINGSIDEDGDTINETKQMYYTNGSIIVKCDDGRYEEYDGVITKSTGLPKFNPTEDSFTSIDLKLSGNVLNMTGTIDCSKANDLFQSTDLDEITNATMKASLYDDKIEEISWNYDNAGMNINQRLTISYSSNTIVAPAL